MLRLQFHLPWTVARAIAQTCPDCHQVAPLQPAGVNPHGLQALQLWQTDVTHIPEFGRQKYVHVSVDTFSGAIWATAETEERSKDILRHWRGVFAALGIPHQIKTDNGPGYISAKTQEFLSKWGVKHTTGMPHSPQGQGIVERSHQTLKMAL